VRKAYDIQPTLHYRDLQYIHKCQASFKSLIVIEEGRSELSLTHLLVAGIEYIGERHVGSYD
jgi:hypothetical protein